MHSTFHALFHHFASRLIRLVNIAVEMIIIRATTARADKFRKAVFTFLTGEYAGIFELFTNFGALDTVEHATHTEIFIPCELMAGIQVAVGGYREIFVARSARGYTLGKARSAF